MVMKTRHSVWVMMFHMCTVLSGPSEAGSAARLARRAATLAGMAAVAAQGNKEEKGEQPSWSRVPVRSRVYIRLETT